MSLSLFLILISGTGARWPLRVLPVTGVTAARLCELRERREGLARWRLVCALSRWRQDDQASTQWLAPGARCSPATRVARVLDDSQCRVSFPYARGFKPGDDFSGEVPELVGIVKE